MNIPRPPWYDALNEKLQSVEWLTDAILIGIVVISLLLLWKGDRLSKTLFAVYMISP